MYELFKTVVILSLFGFGITAALLCVKPVTAKKFPAQWQYYVWIAALIAMLVPVYKFIPKAEVQKIPIAVQNPAQTEQQAAQGEIETVITDKAPIEYRAVTVIPNHKIRLLDLIAYIWLAGVCVFLLVIASSYIAFGARKRKNAVRLSENSILEEVKSELHINRRIDIKMAPNVNSPMLAGLIFPVVYIPMREISDESMKMILLHELTHYKRRDLFVKWLSIFVNAVHWFNPLAYLLCANVSEACEVSCDMSVTKNMSEQEQKIYMKTILELVE